MNCALLGHYAASSGNLLPRATGHEERRSSDELTVRNKQDWCSYNRHTKHSFIQTSIRRYASKYWSAIRAVTLNTLPKSLTVSWLRAERECTHSVDQGLLIPLAGTWYSSVTYSHSVLNTFIWVSCSFISINTV